MKFKVLSWLTTTNGSDFPALSLVALKRHAEHPKRRCGICLWLVWGRRFEWEDLKTVSKQPSFCPAETISYSNATACLKLTFGFVLPSKRRVELKQRISETIDLAIIGGASCVGGILSRNQRLEQQPITDESTIGSMSDVFSLSGHQCLAIFNKESGFSDQCLLVRMLQSVCSLAGLEIRMFYIVPKEQAEHTFVNFLNEN
ncbi:hypothetical protein D918_09904 [Trichuris suis]|nr:hypothetical protein D918_09904 [Trichuris suis]